MRDFEKMSHFCKPQKGFRIIHGKIIIGYYERMDDFYFNANMLYYRKRE